jgi:hypothetical protein
MEENMRVRAASWVGRCDVSRLSIKANRGGSGQRLTRQILGSLDRLQSFDNGPTNNFQTMV